MLNARFLALALLAKIILFAPAANATTVTESFATNPFLRGWTIFGDPNLFQWDSTNQNLRVTWDSSQTNSFFHYPLGTILTRNDDFSLAFDLKLIDIGAGPDTNKSTSFSIDIGFLDLDSAEQTNYLRGTGVDSPDLAELAYFWDSGFGATVWPTLVDSNSDFNYVSSSDYAIFALTPGDWFHIAMNYSASSQAVVMTVTNFEQTSGVRIVQSINQTNFGDYRVGTFSISSFSDAGQDPQYAGSVLAHGVIDNISFTVPSPPVENLAGSLMAGGSWQAHFNATTNWSYTLERTEDFLSWTAVSPATLGTNGLMILNDTNPASGSGCYRVRATHR